jgi:hypothetical protein
VCDIGNGKCRPGVSKDPVLPGQVHLDPNKRYYISILPGDGWITEDGPGVGHTMGGAQIPAAQTHGPVDVFLMAAAAPAIRWLRTRRASAASISC